MWWIFDKRKAERRLIKDRRSGPGRRVSNQITAWIEGEGRRSNVSDRRNGKHRIMHRRKRYFKYD